VTRVALVCSGLGYVPRGFERYTRELFDTVKEDVEVTLFAAAAAGPGEVALRVPHRNGLLASLGAERAYRVELAAFAARLLPHIVRRKIELVHYSEPYLGNVLAAMRRRLGLHFKLLLTDGLGLSARSSSRSDLLHVLTPVAHAEALAGGRNASDIFEIPYGVHPSVGAAVSRSEARSRLGLDMTSHVVLDVAALNRRHKRVDRLIAEAARLPSDWSLLVVGAVEEADLIDEGREQLGARFAHRQLERAEMPLAYAAADVFAHTALEEGFGLAVVEAMSAGLPLALYRSPHFEWLVGDERQLVDGERPGSLSDAILAAASDAGSRNRARAADFDWRRLEADYVEMYMRALSR
jgi:glycosyltransferase involved in cell wall biosynthesis